MINLYFKTAAAAGYSQPPEVYLTDLPGRDAGRYIFGWRSWPRGCTKHIALDVRKMGKLLPVEAEILHELTHWRWRTVSKNALTGEEKHGAAFLAAWIVMLRLIKWDEGQIMEMAIWHADSYELPKQHLQAAIGIAEKTSDPDAAIIETEKLNLRSSASFIANFFK